MFVANLNDTSSYFVYDTDPNAQSMIDAHRSASLSLHFTLDGFSKQIDNNENNQQNPKHIFTWN